MEAKSVFSKMTVGDLVNAFIATDSNNSAEIPTVRGWIMDELERRNFSAFESWMMSDDSSPAGYF